MQQAEEEEKEAGEAESKTSKMVGEAMNFFTGAVTGAVLVVGEFVSQYVENAEARDRLESKAVQWESNSTFFKNPIYEG